MTMRPVCQLTAVTVLPSIRMLLFAVCGFATGTTMQRADAAIVIRVQNTNISAGSSGDVDVLIWGTNNDLL
jgi:hypothetical protein